jgi:hypothetical protein
VVFSQLLKADLKCRKATDGFDMTSSEYGVDDASNLRSKSLRKSSIQVMLDADSQARDMLVEHLCLSAVAVGFGLELCDGGLVEELGVLFHVTPGSSPVGGGDEGFEERGESLGTLACIPGRHELLMDLDEPRGGQVRGRVPSQHGRRHGRGHHIHVGIGEFVPHRFNQRANQVGNGLVRQWRPVGDGEYDAGSRCAPHQQDGHFEVDPAARAAPVGQRRRVGRELVVVDVEHDDGVDLTGPPAGRTDHGAPLASGDVGAHRDPPPVTTKR